MAELLFILLLPLGLLLFCVLLMIVCDTVAFIYYGLTILKGKLNKIFSNQ